ncbi:4-oxalocrotonate tautomerase family protein [Micromonospora sp. KC213]|uniref:tautomerase family protein n=1 Tax=Micromonospora sp. KC213 TaxID=2530378 RepID=UPI001052DCEC|nr:4-oxalocrotonate tautomerase family protein [Micromonospora sp. KC213]TDC43785.1 4-oxalocrotonate tautomerase family protein [Micromonospora sp. KC213]
MPYVNIRVTDERVSTAQKAALIAGATELLCRVLDKEPATTHVVIDEIPLANWGVAGLPVQEYRRRTLPPVG